MTWISKTVGNDLCLVVLFLISWLSFYKFKGLTGACSRAPLVSVYCRIAQGRITEAGLMKQFLKGFLHKLCVWFLSALWFLSLLLPVTLAACWAVIEPLLVFYSCFPQLPEGLAPPVGTRLAAGAVEAALIVLGSCLLWSMGGEDWEAVEAELIPDCRFDSWRRMGRKISDYNQTLLLPWLPCHLWASYLLPFFS